MMLVRSLTLSSSAATVDLFEHLPTVVLAEPLALLADAFITAAGESESVTLDLLTERGGTMYFGLALSLILVGFAVVGVFILIPFVSQYAFWIVIAAYVILAAGRGRGD
jgi:hypothetical protein